MSGPLNPASLPATQLQNWYDAADPMGTGAVPSTNATITEWKDKSGNANHTTGGTGDVQYKNDGSPYLDFPVAGDLTVGGSWYSIPEVSWMSNDYLSIFTVETPARIDARPILGAINNTNGPFNFRYNNTQFMAGQGGPNIINYNSTFPVNTTSLFSYTMTNSPNTYSQSLYHNGKSVTSNSVSSFGSSTVLGFIGKINGLGENHKYMGKMREIIIVKGLLSSTDRERIEGYLALKWNLRTQLPSTHPYNYTIAIPFVSPATTALIQNWYDAADPLATGVAPSADTTITVWKDKSGRVRDTTGGTGDVQYKNDGSAYLDFPVAGDVTFGGSWYSIPEVSWMSNDYLSIFTVETPARIDARPILGAINNTNGPFNFRYNNTQFMAGQGGPNIIEYNSTFPVNTTSLFSYTLTNTPNTYSQLLHQNGQLKASKSASSFNSSVVLGFIGKINGLGENHKYMGKMREIIILQGVISSTERQNIEGYLAAKWGLKSNLPTNHPYYQGLPPGVPTGVTATAGDASAVVSWVAPSSSGTTAIRNYIITPSVGSAMTVGNVLTATVTGLTNATAVTFTVKAVNADNFSPESAPSNSVTPKGLSLPPTDVSATSGNGSATVTWSAPSLDGGFSITNYIVTSSTGLTVTVGNVLTASFTGLANGTTLTFRVKAVNSAGNSADSSASAPVTPDVLPNAPTSVSATRGNASAVVSWSAPPSNGSSAITNYIVTPSAGSPVTVGNVLTATVTGLTNGSPVTFTVVAKNNLGNSPPSSESSPVTPATVAGAPTGVSATAGNGSAEVSWSAPSSDGGEAITNYIVTPSTGSAITVGNVLTASFSGLANGTAVTFTVRAVNNVGNSLPSAASSPVTPATIPDVPTGVVATAGNALVVVNWTAPFNGGSEITNYVVTPSSGSALTVGNVLTATFTELTNGTPLTFTVLARNSLGDSASSSPSLAAIPSVVPGAPTGVSATAGNASAVVTWSAGSNEGTAVTNYIVTPSVGSAITVGNVLTANFANLANGTPLTFTVMAVNSGGNSAPSDPSSSVTPATNPGVPSAPSATRGNSSAVVTWSAPFNGGSEITNYVVTASTGASVTVGNVLTATFGDLENGSPVTFTVLARNSLGDSSASAPSAAVTPATFPNAPSGVSATSGNTSAVVTWSAPSNGGSAITAYIVTPSVGAAVTVGNVLTATVTGLTNGSSVTFTVVARNSVGNSEASSASSPVTPATLPGEPTGVTAVSGSRSAVVSWLAPASDGGSEVTGYTVVSSAGPEVTVGNFLTATVTGLTDGTPVTFTVKAINNLGSSSPSAASSSVIPLSVPGAPVSVTAVAGTNSATLTWGAPVSNGGSPVTGYTIRPSVGDVVTVENVLTATLTGLGSVIPLTFTVVAINSVGTSLPSVPSNSILPRAPIAGPPSSVVNLTGAAGIASARLTWTPPVSNGGAAITGYKVLCVPDNKRANLAGPNDTTILIGGLKNAIPTTLTVIAINSAGQSDSVELTSYPLPGVPKVTAVRGASGVINLLWTAKPSNVASAITGYVVSLVSPLPAPATMVIPPPTLTSTGGAVSVSGLTNGGNYVFSVRSVSNIGQSAGGLSKAMIAARAPDMPTAFAGVKAVKSVSLSWTAPANTGGLPLTGYTISYTVAGVAKVLAVKLVNTAVVKGLVDGTAYSFTIRAVNLIGTSAVTAAVTVTPGP